LAAIVFVVLVGQFAVASESDDPSSMERLRKLLREIIERQRQVGESLRDNFPP
jgi:hypothetical protein